MILLLKLCAIPLYPLGFMMVLLAAGLVVTLRVKHAIGPYIIGTGILLLYVMSTGLVSRIIVKSLEEPYFSSDQLPNGYPVIVVLGGGGMALSPPMVYPEVNSAGDRMLHAARLYKIGVAPIIITTGGFPVGSRSQIFTEGEQNALLLREIGVDSAALIVEKKARNTADHAPLVAAILDSLDLPKKIVLVTSAIHMRRSVGVFKKAGYEVFPAATDFRGNGRFYDNIRDIFPQASALSNSTDAIHEYYGILGYWVLGRM